jgi:CMP-N,N'-diacetyllegionaminic acid synthase
LNCLFIITARRGSKGIPGKNHKLLNGVPLINYSFQMARNFVEDDNICVTTDDNIIAGILKKQGYAIPFIRPAHLSTDSAGSYEVLLHALNHYENSGKEFDFIVLLQPTSPFRTRKQVTEAIQEYSKGIDMVVSVTETRSNPYYSLYKENESGYLEKLLPGNYIRRQDVPPVYEYNGAIYVINVKSLKQGSMESFTKIQKYIMDDLTSVDLDSPLDWIYAESIIKYYPDLLRDK